MKKTIFALLTVLCLSIMIPGPEAQAKWWIFGSSEEEVTINYLYINRVSYDEMGPKVMLYREALADGLIVLTGKASVVRGTIGSVRVSVDGRETWLDAKLSEGGAFEWSLRPEMGKTYKFYVEIMDTSGKTNRVEDTYREISLSDKTIQPIIREALDKLIEAYRNEDPARFMALIADDFAGEKANLDRAVRKDFSALDNINLRYTLNNVSTDSKGKVFVSLNYTRQVTSARSGQTLKDAGATEFVFRFGEKTPLVYSMKWPLIFGISEPENVATGDVVQPGNTNILVMDNKGVLQSLPFTEAKQAKDNGGSTVSSKSATIPFNSGFKFVDDSVVASGSGDITVQLMGMMGTAIFMSGGPKYKVLPATGVDALTEVPDQTTYNTFPPEIFGVTQGQTIALYLSTGKYAVFEVRTITGTAMTIRYKYQPSGTRFF